MPAIAEACDTAQCGLRVTTDPDRRTRTLDWHWLAYHLLEAVEAAAVGDRLAGPQFTEDVDVLVGDCAATREVGRMQGAKFLLHPPDADADCQTPARQHVNGRQGLGIENGV